MSWTTKKAIQELVRGRELTNQVRDLLTYSLPHESGLVESEDLVIKIRNTFANTLSILRKSNTADYYNDGNNDGRKSEGSGESIKTSPSTLKVKDRRRSYKRSKCVESRTDISSALVDDGYAWRKYGQKQILNANRPRSYYRCTHKKEQGCQATKQVQKIEDDPPKYETIYLGHHTCKDTLNPCHLIMDHSDSSLLISFANHQDRPFFSSVKQETKGDYLLSMSEITYNNDSSSSHSHHPSTFDPSAEMSVLSADHDVISGMVDSVLDLDELLEF
ncbi:WRKY DNA-binding protein 70 [Hibiscus syriacus]|uniref:WRKY DNA-binding protein 70 n=1 Tax=Hibiscus syriacus TaxID=106335 RepID=A0A6A3BEX8_HIBSY|nr:probable WRKY transcription factor 70 [Hibiscus syriacus]KAE8714441.1 WRKY DNA-binding protein 70 [Hibiscus syriacus]